MGYFFSSRTYRARWLKNFCGPITIVIHFCVTVFSLINRFSCLLRTDKNLSFAEFKSVFTGYAIFSIVHNLINILQPSSNLM